MSNPWTEVYKDIREPFLQEKMAKKDYDGDGKIETGTQEYMGSRDKAIKKAMGKDPKKEMKKESMHSSNPAQQAAIAMAKKKREEDMMVDKKKKMKEEMKVQPPAQKLKTDRNMFQIPKSEQDAARERVLAKTKAKREKMAKEGVDEESLNELSPNTMRNYIIGATKDVAYRAADPESRSGPKYGKKMSRMDGIMTAGDKLAKKAEKNYKEDVEPVIEEMEQFGLFMDMFVEQELEEELMDDILEIIYEKCWLSEKAQKCWKGYEKKGTKKMFGKTYNNCVKKEEVEEIDEAMTVTNADKKGNTPAYQNYIKGMKSKVTGKPMYKAADHMKDDK